MKVKLSQTQCNECHRLRECPEQNPEISVKDYVEWMTRNCPQYPKK
jgi:peptide subunit release factor 1 (eRF1)